MMRKEELRTPPPSIQLARKRLPPPPPLFDVSCWRDALKCPQRRLRVAGPGLRSRAGDQAKARRPVAMLIPTTAVQCRSTYCGKRGAGAGGGVVGIKIKRILKKMQLNIRF